MLGLELELGLEFGLEFGLELYVVMIQGSVQFEHARNLSACAEVVESRDGRQCIDPSWL